jgi:hypothetical protein
MRIRWDFGTVHDGGETGGQALLAAGRRDRVVATLYEETAAKGDHPMIEVELFPDPAIEQVAQGTVISVAGVPEAGHAVAVVVGTTVLWPSYPATLRLRSRKL